MCVIMTIVESSFINDVIDINISCIYLYLRKSVS